MQIFQPLRALKRLTLGGLDFEDWNPNPPSNTAVQTSLPTLEVIEFYNTEYYILGDILVNILAPCLRQVIIHDAQHVDDIGSTFQGFWNHSTRFPRLHSLVLDRATSSCGRIPDAGALWAVFGFFHSIRIVTCKHRRCDPEAILHSLSFAHRDGWYFPRLKRLTVYPTSEVIVDLLRRIVHNRVQAEALAPREGVTRLETLEVHSEVPIDQSDADDLAKAVSTLKWMSEKPDWEVNKDRFLGQYYGVELTNEFDDA